MKVKTPLPPPHSEMRRLLCASWLDKGHVPVSRRNTVSRPEVPVPCAREQPGVRWAWPGEGGRQRAAHRPDPTAGSLQGPGGHVSSTPWGGGWGGHRARAMAGRSVLETAPRTPLPLGTCPPPVGAFLSPHPHPRGAGAALSPRNPSQVSDPSTHTEVFPPRSLRALPWRSLGVPCHPPSPGKAPALVLGIRGLVLHFPDHFLIRVHSQPTALTNLSPGWGNRSSRSWG